MRRSAEEKMEIFLTPAHQSVIETLLDIIVWAMCATK